MVIDEIDTCISSLKVEQVVDKFSNDFNRCS